MLEISTPGGLSINHGDESATGAEQANWSGNGRSRPRARRLSAGRPVAPQAELGASFDEVDILPPRRDAFTTPWATICWRSCSWIRPQATRAPPQRGVR